MFVKGLIESWTVIMELNNSGLSDLDIMVINNALIIENLFV
jgi:hypothetical protein